MKKYHLYFTSDERRLLLDSLIDMKNELIRTGHYTDAIDEIIIMLTQTKIKKVHFNTCLMTSPMIQGNATDMAFYDSFFS